MLAPKGRKVSCAVTLTDYRHKVEGEKNNISADLCGFDVKEQVIHFLEVVWG